MSRHFKNLKIAFTTAFVSIIFASCTGSNSVTQLLTSNLFDTDEFSQKSHNHISQFISKIEPADTSKSEVSYISQAITQAYQVNNNNPIWYTAKGLKPVADSLLKSIDFIKNTEGISLDQIQDGIDYLNKNIKSENLDTIIHNDIVMSYVYATLCERILLGNKPPKFSKYWQIANDSIQKLENPLVLVSNSSDSFQLWSPYRSDVKEYSAMLTEIQKWQELKKDKLYSSYKSTVNSKSADSVIQYIINKELGLNTPIQDTLNPIQISTSINQYQKFYSIKETGELDESTVKILKRTPEYYIEKLSLNLERLRWIPKSLGEEYVYVNIPLMELFYKKDKKEIFHSKVIVGKSARPTPSISMKMTDIVFNPPWGVPPTILNQDVGPGVARSGGNYLSRKGLRAYDSRGRDVTSQVNGSNYKKFRIAQPPGAGNALGDVKFNMPNSEAIFIHDTPNRGQFKNSHRALSSGCVRTENPKILAEIILKNKGYDMEKINSVISTRRTEKVDLDKQIPVYILYLTTHYDETDKRIHYLHDVYGKDKI